jgi:selenocysteine-specific translation elongation factor
LNDSNMFEMQVDDIFTITGRGTVFVGQIQSGSISIYDTAICRMGSKELPIHVVGIEESGTSRALQSAQAGTTVGVVCRAIDLSSLSDAFTGEGDQARVVGTKLLSLSLGTAATSQHSSVSRGLIVGILIASAIVILYLFLIRG